MQITQEELNPTKLKLTIVAEAEELATVKQHVLKKVSKNIKVQGFRPGKAPAALIEKQIDPNVLQSEFLEHAVNDLYVAAIEEKKLRPAAQPEVNVTKFVPFTTLEFTAELEAVGEVKLADYKKIKLPQTDVKVAAKDVDEVLDNLRERAAEKVTVDRAAKNGDEVTIDFKGTDAKTKEPIDGADGSEYPLVLGSKQFIPGFEDEVVGLKAGETKSFVITFPKDYGAKQLQGAKVNFEVTAQQVQELKKAALDDTFAATVGPFKTVAELKADIKKQLTAEREREAQRDYDNQLIEAIAAKTTVAIPESLIESEIDAIEEQEKRDVTYRGQTWQEHLDAEGVTAEQHREKQREGAELRVKAGLILGEVAQAEDITVTPEELEIRLMLLKNQYTDAAMQAELDKPESRRDIMSRMLTEKTLDKLRSYATV